jgi:hypothetical protein
LEIEISSKVGLFATLFDYSGSYDSEEPNGISPSKEL